MINLKQPEFDIVKDIPTKNIPRIGKVHLNMEYFVDLNDDDMVKHAKECLYEDVMSLVKYDELYNAINVDEAPEASTDNIPEFLLTNENYED